MAQPEPLIKDEFAQALDQLATPKKRVGRPPGSGRKATPSPNRPKNPGDLEADVYAIVTLINRTFMGFLPAKAHYGLKNGFLPEGFIAPPGFPAWEGYNQLFDEEKALSHALAVEIGANTRLQGMFGKAVAVSPHLLLAQVVLGLAGNRLLMYQAEKAQQRANANQNGVRNRNEDVPAPVSVENWGTRRDSGEHGEGEDISRIASVIP